MSSFHQCACRKGRSRTATSGRVVSDFCSPLRRCSEERWPAEDVSALSATTSNTIGVSQPFRGGAWRVLTGPVPEIASVGCQHGAQLITFRDLVGVMGVDDRHQEESVPACPADEREPRCNMGVGLGEMHIRSTKQQSELI